MAESCYFFIDAEAPVEEQHMLVHCVKCHDEHFPQQGTFWEGANGYGPFVFKCDYCGKIIHQPNEENTNTDKCSRL